MKLQPAGDMVLVQDIAQGSKIADIELPDNQRQPEMIFGVVIATGNRVSADTEPGDSICYGPYAGKLVIIGGVESRLLREGQIEGYLRKE